MAAEHAAHLWSFLDELAESDPDAYHKFIRKQTEEFRNISSRTKGKGCPEIPSDWLEQPAKRKPLIEEVDEFTLPPAAHKPPQWMQSWRVVRQEEANSIVVEIEFAHGHGLSTADVSVTVVGEDKLEVDVGGKGAYLIDLETGVNGDQVVARLNPRKGRLKVFLNQV